MTTQTTQTRMVRSLRLDGVVEWHEEHAHAQHAQGRSGVDFVKCLLEDPEESESNTHEVDYVLALTTDPDDIYDGTRMRASQRCARHIAAVDTVVAQHAQHAQQAQAAQTVALVQSVKMFAVSPMVYMPSIASLVKVA